MDTPIQTFPSAFLERLAKLYPPEVSQQVLKSFDETRVTTFRINTLKATKEQVLAALANSEVEIEEIIGIPNAFILKKPSLRAFSEFPVYTNGWIYVQSLSSMLPPLILNPQPNEKVLDITAAPGSKTSQMAAIMNNTGEIVANDSSHIRIYKLKANLERLGVQNVTVKKGMAQLVWQEYSDYFDKTLVDVPCSMEGRFDAKDPKTYHFWTPNKVKELSHMQRVILRSAITATKPGGTIVYSTCTLSPEENEGVIDWILNREPGTVTVEGIQFPGLPSLPGIVSWNDKSFDSTLSKTVRILPTEQFEGFYVALLRKTIV